MDRNAPCDSCSVGLYCIDHHEPSQRYAQLPKKQQFKKAPPCKKRPHLKCRGALDIALYVKPKHPSDMAGYPKFIEIEGHEIKITRKTGRTGCMGEDLPDFYAPRFVDEDMNGPFIRESTEQEAIEAMRTFITDDFEEITLWLDSGANIHSRQKVTFSKAEFPYSKLEWETMSEENKFDIIAEHMYNFEWGYDFQ